MRPKSGADLRDYLAGERTFLAWIRTGLALMGFGFVLAHFGIFADAPDLARVGGNRTHGLSLWFGVALIGVGVLVNLYAARRYVRLIGALNGRQFVHLSVSRQGIAVAVFLAVLGVAVTIYMVLVLAQAPDVLHASWSAVRAGVV